jgi:acyl-CoA synthetase (AMP-forming)/AMP-acid ligase II
MYDARVRVRGVLSDVLAEAARRFGDRTAYVTDEWSCTYAQLERLTAEVAAGLHDRGVREGSVLALALPPSIEYAACYLAAATLGAVTAGVNLRLSRVEQQRVLDIARPDLLVTLGDGPAYDVDRVALRSRLAELRVDGGRAPALERDRDRPVAVVFTSGTTGTPKGAEFAWRQLDAIRAIEVGEQWAGGGQSLFATSMAHLGFMTKIGSFLQSGATAHLVPRWSADDALRRTSSLGLTAVTGVPTQLALMLASPAIDAVDLSSVRTVVIGGGPATPALVREVRSRFGVPVVTRYSCTEAGIGCGTRPDDPSDDAEQTVGRAQPGVDLTIRDGEVLLRSAAVMSRYWGDPVGTASAFTEDGYVRTGDLGEIDDRGRLRLVGRRKEMYVRGGYNVFPVEVEAVLASHPSVAAVAVVPRAHDVMGEIGVAVVVPRGDAPTLESLREVGRARLAAYKLPEDVVVVQALPLTAGDKVDRAALLRVVGGQGAS